MGAPCQNRMFLPFSDHRNIITVSTHEQNVLSESPASSLQISMMPFICRREKAHRACGYCDAQKKANLWILPPILLKPRYLKKFCVCIKLSSRFTWKYGSQGNPTEKSSIGSLSYRLHKQDLPFTHIDL